MPTNRVEGRRYFLTPASTPYVGSLRHLLSAKARVPSLDTHLEDSNVPDMKMESIVTPEVINTYLLTQTSIFTKCMSGSSVKNILSSLFL